MLKVYEYSNCSTCKQALKYLDAKKIKYSRMPIVESPPTVSELKQVLVSLRARGGDLKSLFNTSGVQYRELGMAEKLKAGLSESEALKLLSQNGKLVKRPFLLTADSGAVGFKADEWTKLLK
ncbi:arsenate reductase family protein [soil metagenome]